MVNPNFKPIKSKSGGNIKFSIALIFVLITMLSAQTAKAQEKEAYVVIENGTMTFYYTLPEYKPTDNVYSIPDGYVWNDEIRGTITKADFDVSFQDYEPTSCASWFYNLSALTQINNLKYLNTSKVTTMSSMFSNCESLESLDISNFDTKEVENMNSMFAVCKSLKSLTFDRNFTTGKVTDMYGMFTWCCSLSSLNLSNFSTSLVEKMHDMFSDCYCLESIEFSNLFNTSSVKNMSQMFYNCQKLKILDLRSFNTASVIDMKNMFFNCTNLSTIDFGNNFTTEKVKNMSGMFLSCSNLTELDLSSINNTKDVTDMSYMFRGCSRIKTLDLRQFSTDKVTNINGIFFGCDSLTTILVAEEGWNFQSLENPDYLNMYNGSVNLIGGAGSRNKYEDLARNYLKIDGGPDDPGFFTTKSYKIFYDVYGAYNIEMWNNINTFAWSNGILPPSYFPIDNTYDIIISQHPIREGYEFKGWVGSSITGLTYSNPSDIITIKKGDVGNRIYSALWKPVFNTPETISIPPDPDKIIDFCQNGIRSASFTVQLHEDWKIIGCELSIPGFTAECTSPNDGECIITITSPDGTNPGRYKGNITLNLNFNTQTDPYPITIDVTAVKGAILHLYKDVVFISNKDKIYKSSGYQWYKDGAEIPNANYQYVYDKEMSNDHTYMARMVTENDNLTVYACGIPGGVDISKSFNEPVKTYPNPAVEGQAFNIEIMDYDPETSYSIIISNNSGAIVKEIYNAEQISTIALPRGVYSGALISGGRKHGFKLIVK